MNKTALVTGSTAGIGKAAGIALLKSGYDVIFNYSKNSDKAEALKAELKKYTGHFHIIRHDMSLPSQAEAFVSKVKEIADSIDCVIFNAGDTRRTEFGSIKEEDWDFLFNINLKVPFFILQAMNEMVNENGRIIFIGSLLGNVPHAIGIPYGVSKAGVHMLSRYLVKAFNERKITVNSIAPGFTETDWHSSKSSELKKKIEGKIALHRFADPEEIAKTCMFIIENPYVNGQIINVDGGYDYM